MDHLNPLNVWDGNWTPTLHGSHGFMACSIGPSSNMTSRLKSPRFSAVPDKMEHEGSSKPLHDLSDINDSSHFVIFCLGKFPVECGGSKQFKTMKQTSKSYRPTIPGGDEHPCNIHKNPITSTAPGGNNALPGDSITLEPYLCRARSSCADFRKGLEAGRKARNIGIESWTNPFIYTYLIHMYIYIYIIYI